MEDLATGGEAVRDTKRARWPKEVTERLQGIVRDAVIPVCRRHPDISRLYLFGSVARGDFDRESDVDLWVHVDDEALEKPHELLRIHEDLEGAISPTKADVVSVTDRRDLTRIWDGLQRDKVLLYERAADR